MDKITGVRRNYSIGLSGYGRVREPVGWRLTLCAGRDELHRLIVLLLLQLIIGLMECGRNLLVMAIMNCRILLSSRKVFFYAQLAARMGKSSMEEKKNICVHY